MASISTVMKILEASRLSGVAIWVWGAHGCGKSETVMGASDKLHINTIDIRSALTEAGDWLGLPATSRDSQGKAIAEYYMSSFLPQDPNWKGFIFLDELNRARPDVLNCVFQLVLNRRIMNHYMLPAGATIVAAGNPSDDDYQVTDVDPALLSRFCHISLTSPREEWLSYAKTNVRDDIRSFISSSDAKTLDHKVKEFDISLITPNRRGWTMLSKMVDALEKLGYLDECLIDVASGLIGSNFAVQFEQFRNSSYARIDVDKILPAYESIRDQVKKFVEDGRLPEQAEAIEILFEKIKLNDEKVVEDNKQFKNLMMFVTDIAQDVAYHAAQKITERCPHIMTKILDGVQKKEEYSLKFFNVIQDLHNIGRGKQK